MATSNENFYIGIDVSKAMLDVYILPTKKHYRLENNPKGFK